MKSVEGALKPLAWKKWLGSVVKVAWKRKKRGQFRLD